MTEMVITKADPKKKMIFGFFNINKIRGELVEDLQGDLIPTEELEPAVYQFNLDARRHGLNHLEKDVGRLVESFMITEEKLETMSKCLSAQGIENILTVECEGWFGGFKIDNDEIWEDIEKGKFPAFSIGGRGERVPVGE